MAAGNATLDLFGAGGLPEGMKYEENFLSAAEEQALLHEIQHLPFREFEFHGFTGKRRTVSFGWRYDFNGGGLTKTEDMPQFLKNLCVRAERFASIAPGSFQQVLITDYAPGAGIGWHKDRSVFGDVVGISLLSSCTFRLRKRSFKGFTRKSHRCAPFCVSPERPVPHGMGAQHPRGRKASLLRHVPQCTGGRLMARVSTLPKRLQPMLATLTDAPFDDKGWIFEDKYDGFRMVAKSESGSVTLYSRNGKIISHNDIEIAKALEGVVKGNAVIDGELVPLDKEGVSRFQLLQNARRSKARLQYCAFDLMFIDGEDLRALPLIERKKRLKEILPKHKLIAFSRHGVASGTKFFEEAERRGLEGIMAKRADSKYLSGARTDGWLKIKTSKRQEVVIAGFTVPRRTRPFFGALTLALREGDNWRYVHRMDRFRRDASSRLSRSSQR